MANPYPPNQGMHGMQPMQQQMHPMGQMPPQQMQQAQRPKATRSGTSRAVPVVVSAGLAVGVFCGLLFGVGIPEDATASPSTGNNVKAADPSEPTPTPTASTSTATTPGATASKPATAATAGTAAGSGSATVAAGTTAGSGSAATTNSQPAAGSGSGSSTPTAAATPAVKKVKLIVEVKPDAVAATAKITVDKKDITGGMTELELPGDGKMEVKVVVKASGYKTVEQKVEIEGDVTVKVELIKRSGGGGSGGGSTPSRPPTGGGKKKPSPGGGLIDI